MAQTTRRLQRTSRTSIRVAVGALALGALASTVLTTATANAASSKAKSLSVSTIKNTTLGTILVSGNRTVYIVKPSKKACTAACIKVWPEVLLPKGVKHASANGGVPRGKLGTVKRGSRLQVTYGGKALYWFTGDSASGQANGNVTDLWGKWSVVVTAKPAQTLAPSVGATTTTPTTPTPTTAKTTPTTTRPTSSTPATTPLPPPTTTPTTQPAPPPTTTTPTTSPPPPTTTTAPGGGGVGF